MTDPDGELSTIDDLIARAKLEPTLVDVYVEGRRDADLVRSMFREAGIDASVFAVSDRLHITREETAPHSSDYGNKAKLVAAAARLDAALGASGHGISFIADSDWSPVIGPMMLGDTSLFLTDGPSMECYFFVSASFQQVLTSGLERAEASADVVRAQLLGAMQDVASARLLLEEMDVAIIEKFVAVCFFEKNESRADALEIVRRSLNAARRGKEFSTTRVDQQLQTYRQWISVAGHMGRGHDIAPMLIKLLKLSGDLAKSGVIEAMMRSSVRVSELLMAPLFQRVVSRIRAQSALSAARS